MTETAFLSFGFSGSGTSCNVSPFWAAQHHWYTWNALIHKKKAYWPTASHILLWFYFWAKTVRKTNRIWLQTARARNLFLWFPLYIWCLLWCRQFLICSLNFGGVNRSYLVTDEHMYVFIFIRYNEEKETERINFTRKSRSNSLQRQKFSDNNFGNCSEVSML